MAFARIGSPRQGSTRDQDLRERSRARIEVNAACPGWVRTKLGGSGATRSVEDGAATTIRLATLPDDGSSGGLFRYKSRSHGEGIAKVRLATSGRGGTS